MRVIDKLCTIFCWVCYGIAAALTVYLIISRVGIFEERYAQYINWLGNLELVIASLNYKTLIVIVIFLMYYIKTCYPLYPVSILCVATALVFKPSSAVIINSVGVLMLFTVRYLTGVWSGGGNLKKLINKSRGATDLVVHEGTGNPWLLLSVRLLPGIPLHGFSQLYGDMRFPFVRYLLISYVGYLPRMISYIVIGRNVSNPFSLKFSIPLIALFIFSGLSLHATHLILNSFVLKRKSADNKGDKIKNEELSKSYST